MKRLLSPACVALCLAACAGQTPTIPSTASPAGISQTPASGTRPTAATQTATSAPATDAPPPSATPTPDCHQVGGRIESHGISDDRLPRPLPFVVYLPACYDQDAPQRYPVLYMFHGLAEDDHEWIDLGLTDSANELIRTGAIPPFVIVFPWERTGLDMDVAVPDVLVPYIDQHYRTQADPRARAIGGLSRGGGWALHIGIRNLDQFGVIGLHSPAPFGVDLAMLPRWVERQPGTSAPKIWIDIGDHDTLLPSTQKLTDLLDGIPLDYTFVLGDGWHDADYWSKNVETYLRWYGSAW